MSWLNVLSPALSKLLSVVFHISIRSLWLSSHFACLLVTGGADGVDYCEERFAKRRRVGSKACFLVYPFAVIASCLVRAVFTDLLSIIATVGAFFRWRTLHFIAFTHLFLQLLGCL